MTVMDIPAIEQARVCQRRLVHSLRQHLSDSLQKVVHFNKMSSRASLLRAFSRQSTVAAHSASVDIESNVAELEKLATAFVVTGAGDSRVNGEWRSRSQDFYNRIVEFKAMVKWDEEASEWQMCWDDTVLYRLSWEAGKEGTSDRPAPLSDAWQVVEGAEPPPSTVACDVNQKKRLLHYEVFDWFWQTNPPELLQTPGGGSPENSACLSREDTGFAFTPDSGLEEERAIHWRDLRGPYGETIVSWLWTLRSHDKAQGRLQSFYRSLTQWILCFEPELAGVRVCREPYVGKTILHQACAASDVDLVDFIVNEPQIKQQPFFMEGLLEAPLIGKFIPVTRRVPDGLQEVFDEATPPDEDDDWNGPTPLEVACMAPTDDAKCEAIVKLLLQAGASPIFYHMVTGEVRYNLLHVVARSSWFRNHEEAPHMSASRTKLIVSLFMSHHSEFYQKWGLAMQSQPNSRGISPLKTAAMFGNEDALTEILDHMKVEVWEWGGKREVGFPLCELDSGANDDRICALELMTVYRHGHMLSLSLIAEIVAMKWEKFGMLWFRRLLANQIICWCCTTLVCLDDTAGYSWIRHGARTCLLICAGAYILTLGLLFVLCGRDEEWFEHMDFSIFFPSTIRVNFFQLIAVRNAFELLCMVLIAGFPPWYAGDSVKKLEFYGVVWHCLASLWFLSGMSFFCSYLELFKSTSALALAVPEVARRDMVPFFTLFMVIYLSCAVALRIAVEAGETTSGHTVPDRTFGSFFGVLKSLEEATHGPDLNWRAAMEKQPQPAGAIFVLFLWVTLIMLSLLIAMFSNTFDALRSRVNERLMSRRAMFCVTIEKLFPQWYHRHHAWGAKGCNIGSRLGVSLADTKDLLETLIRPTPWSNKSLNMPNEASTLISPASGYGSAPSTSRQSMSPRRQPEGLSPDDEDRWLLWAKADETFENWRKPVHVDLFENLLV